MSMVSKFKFRDLSGHCPKCDGKGHVLQSTCHWCEGTGGDPAKNYTVFEWAEGIAVTGRPIVQTCKAYKADRPATVRDLERKGWLRTWFHGTRAECVAEAKRRNGHQIRYLEREIAHMQQQITKLRRAAR
jgi:hypothetical protein